MQKDHPRYFKGEVIKDEVRGEDEARKEAGLIALHLRTAIFNEVIRFENKPSRLKRWLG